MFSKNMIVLPPVDQKIPSVEPATAHSILAVTHSSLNCTECSLTAGKAQTTVTIHIMVMAGVKAILRNLNCQSCPLLLPFVAVFGYAPPNSSCNEHISFSI